MMRDRVSRGLLVAGALGLVSAAGAQPRFVALGDLSGGSFRSRAEGISGDGSTVVGYSFVAGNLIEAFRWTGGGGMVGLGKLGSAQSESAALAVDRDGSEIAGQADTNPPFVRQPALWSGGAGLTPLGWVQGEDIFSSASAISDDGATLAGTGQVAAGPFGIAADRAFVWRGGLFTLIEPNDPEGDTRGLGISGTGEVVVGAKREPAATVESAFVWSQGGGLRELGFLTGGRWSVATAASSDGSIISGTADPGTLRPGSSEMFRWTEAGGMSGLGLLAGGSGSRAFDMTPDGLTIVGHADGPTVLDYRAAIWTARSGLRTVESALLERGRPLPAGWVLKSATGVSDDGTRVVGWGFNPSGDIEGWMVELSGCYGDCDESGALDVFDFLCFQDAFVRGDPFADCTGDGSFDVLDFLCFQDAFAIGCP